MPRVLRCDGVVAMSLTEHSPRETTPRDLRDIRDWLAEHGETRTDFDIVIEGETPGDAIQAGKSSSHGRPPAPRGGWKRGGRPVTARGRNWFESASRPAPSLSLIVITYTARWLCDVAVVTAAAPPGAAMCSVALGTRSPSCSAE